MADENRRDSSADSIARSAQAAGALKNSLKSGKQAAGALKGAALGPYGLAAAAYENRKLIGKVLAVLLVFLLLPVGMITMLPGILLGGSDESEETEKVWNTALVEKALLEDDAALQESLDSAEVTVLEIMERAYERTLAEIEADFARYSPEDRMELHDPYADGLPCDPVRILCEFSAANGLSGTVDLQMLREKLTEYENNFFFFMAVETPEEREERFVSEDGSTEYRTVPYLNVTYSVIYMGDDYLTDDVFCLTEEQKKLAEDYADSLSLWKEEERGETD